MSLPCYPYIHIAEGNMSLNGKEFFIFARIILKTQAAFVKTQAAFLVCGRSRFVYDQESPGLFEWLSINNNVPRWMTRHVMKIYLTNEMSFSLQG